MWVWSYLVCSCMCGSQRWLSLSSVIAFQLYLSRALLNLKLICLVKLTSHGASGICLHSSPWPSAGVHTHTAIPGFLHGVWGAAQALLSVQQTRYFKKSYIFLSQKKIVICVCHPLPLSVANISGLVDSQGR